MIKTILVIPNNHLSFATLKQKQVRSSLHTAMSFKYSSRRILTIFLVILFIEFALDIDIFSSLIFPKYKDKRPSFNIIITTSGRSTLIKMLQSIAPQLHARDYLTIISDKEHDTVDRTLSRIRCRCKITHISNPEPLGFWGHGSRTRWQNELPGDYHMNADDDDIYDPHAMEIVRSVIGMSLEPHLYVFHMIRRWDGVVDIIPPLGVQGILKKQIGTPCGVYRKIPNLPSWHGSYGGDGNFYRALSDRVMVTFVPEIIYQVGQDEDLLSIKHTMLENEYNYLPPGLPPED